MKTKRTRLAAGRPLTKRERAERKAEAEGLRRSKEKAAAIPTVVIACAGRDDADRIGILFHKLARNVDHAAVLDEFVRFFDDGSVKHVRIPPEYTVQSVFREIAAACSLPKGSIEGMRAAILKTLGHGDVLIVRDLHHLAGSAERECRIMGFLREIHDVTGCAIVTECQAYYRPDEQFARRISHTTHPPIDWDEIEREVGLTPHRPQRRRRNAAAAK